MIYLLFFICFVNFRHRFVVGVGVSLGSYSRTVSDERQAMFKHAARALVFDYRHRIVLWSHELYLTVYTFTAIVGCAKK